MKHATLSRIACTAVLGIATFGIASGSVAAEPPNFIFQAANVVEDEGGSERINFSGKLRMLSQRIPAASCNLKAGVDPFNSSAMLNGATAEFNKIIAALEFGDPKMGVTGVEKNRKSLAAIQAVKEVWAPVAEASNAFLDEAQTTQAEALIAAQNMPLLDKAKLLVSQLSGQYSDPSALVQSDAIRIDIAGRQRMLTQKVSKEACHILSDIDADVAKNAMPGTIQMFEISLTALQFGMPEAGIKASTDPKIADGLAVVAANWAAVKPHLSAIQAGETLDLATRADLFNGLNATMANMNKVVGLYSDASKLGL